MPLVFDPTQKGFQKVLRDYQIEALRIIWNHEGEGLTSREVYEATNEVLGPRRRVSRASIINFLNAMVDEGVLDYSEETCKGGMRRRYKKGLDEREFKKFLVQNMISSLYRDFPAETEQVIAETFGSIMNQKD